jgi:hypothetical protein
MIRPARWISRWRRNFELVPGLMVAILVELNVSPKKRCYNFVEAL